MLNTRTTETSLARIPGLKVVMTLLPRLRLLPVYRKIGRTAHAALITQKTSLAIGGPRRSFTKPAKLREHHPILVRRVDP